MHRLLLIVVFSWLMYPLVAQEDGTFIVKSSSKKTTPSKYIPPPDKGTFKAFVHAGFNINQIEGDSISGFNYWGFTAGGGAYFMLHSKFSLQAELNYTMRGASGEVFDDLGQFQYHRTIHTNYIEIPIIFNYHDKKVARFGLGVVLAGLVNTKQWYNLRPSFTNRTKNYYNDINLSMVASVAFSIGRHFGVNMRLTHSIIPTNKPSSSVEKEYHSDLSVKGMYYF